MSVISGRQRLFEPIKIGSLNLRNRLFLSGHDTGLARKQRVTDSLVAFIEARARGGVGLVITGAMGVIESMMYDRKILMADKDDCIEGLSRLPEACHRHGCPIFGQLLHGGRHAYASSHGGGLGPIPYAPSSIQTELTGTTSQEMSIDMIQEVIEAYASGANRLKKAGFDGIEILFSHGYLPIQFFNPRLNNRIDAYGGSFENRLRFGREIIAGVRDAVGSGMVVGIRISVNEMDHEGLQPDEATSVCAALDSDNLLDYFNVCAGTESTQRGVVYYIPPMGIKPGYTAPLAKTIRDAVNKPVFVVGRINEPQIAEQILAEGQADMCGMARALICDPELPNKAANGLLDDIRACIGCNQACQGRLSLGYHVSCIQHPESGRELRYGIRKPVARRKHILVVGGGPAGMKAAAVAAERGHAVTLCERSRSIGGQALLAQLLPSREEFGGIVQNLSREMTIGGVEVRLNTEVNRAYIEKLRPDTVVIATGAQPWLPCIEGADDGHVVNAWQVLKGEVEVGKNVLIADGRGDWIGAGLANLLVRRGHGVRLSVTSTHPASNLDSITSLFTIGQLAKLEVEVIPNSRLYGTDEDSAYLQHTITHQPIICEDVQTVVLALGHQSVNHLASELSNLGCDVLSIGDCINPRTAEEAVLEGLQAGVAI